jgi:hypothetical protein
VYERNGVKYALPPVFFRKYRGVKASPDEKHPVFIETDEWKMHEDGAAFEMAVRPSHNPRDLFDRIHECLQVTQEGILSRFPDDCLPELEFLPTIGWEIARWENEGEDFFMATRFGCDPDFDAFGTKIPSRTIDASKWAWRYSGGHIHFSGSPMIMEDPILAVKCQALTSGLAAIAYSDTPDLDRLRTETYGKPGKHRVQNYGRNNPYGEQYRIGLEYRTISSRWASSWDIARQVFQWGEIGIVNLLETDLGPKLVEKYAVEACDAILNAKQDLAKELLESVSAYL